MSSRWTTNRKISKKVDQLLKEQTYQNVTEGNKCYKCLFMETKY